MDTIEVMLWMDTDYDPPRLAVTTYKDVPDENNPLVAERLSEHIVRIPADTPLADLPKTAQAAALVQQKRAHNGNEY